jgi:hypothetical protein
MHTCRLSTVSMLCAYTSRPERASICTAVRSPWKSGVRHSTSMLGFFALISCTVRAKWLAPPSGRSSRSTDVSTM